MAKSGARPADVSNDEFEAALAGPDKPTTTGIIEAANDLRRRHLDESQRAMAAARIADMRQGSRTDLSPIGEKSQAEAAEKLNVSKRSVERARVVLDNAAPEVVKLVEDGKMAVSAAVAVARATPTHGQGRAGDGRRLHVPAALGASASPMCMRSRPDWRVPTVRTGWPGMHGTGAVR